MGKGTFQRQIDWVQVPSSVTYKLCLFVPPCKMEIKTMPASYGCCED